jgi:hypothetical protein
VVFFFPNTKAKTSAWIPDAVKLRKKLVTFYKSRFNVAMEEDHKSIEKCV